MVFYVYADLCSLLAATSQFSILIGQKMQLTGCHNDNEMRNAICVDTKISIEWPYCSFLYCDLGPDTYGITFLASEFAFVSYVASKMFRRHNSEFWG